ncbi:putative heavy metal-associated domain, HMA [Rosa chinensis]|uniref:Putative heavy metal-associated domain, HMA n=1 Tax=Rosa chinensis TaxID=74649 RepID=A0A2P6REP6_ROSCH|nr:heavy metal-associated isoprenylated plant protein 47 [Rosa chinensis]PRQ44902.1 putative heavy metal-associated domain, HMA [Rosa chinensis]
MMQKILVKLQVHCDKCRTKAMKIAASAPGVNKVSIQGEHRDHVEVIGDGFDSVCLTRALRKRLGSANLVKVEQVKGSTDN